MAIRTRKTEYAIRDWQNMREIALCILLEITENDRKSHTILKEKFEESKRLGVMPDSRDRAFTERLVVGTLDRLITIDTVLGRFLRRPLRMLKPVIRGILRTGVYQLMYMDRVPASAACNEAVALTKLHGLEGLGSFVNGVMRAVAREIEANGAKVTVFEEDWQRYSLPKWLCRMITEQYGEERSAGIFEAFLQERPETLRFNLSRTGSTDPEEAERMIAESLRNDGAVLRRLDYHKLLAEAGQSLPEGMLPVVYEAEGSGDITRTESFRKGWVTVQDPSSALVAACAAPSKNDYIIDVCAAPGGKALALADRLMLLGGRGVVDARDVSAQKVALLEENVRRCGFANIRTSVRDALKPDEDSYYRADILIADLPCSGIGVIAKKPDIKLNLEAFSIGELQQLQRDILVNISRFVKPRGRLIYSTCTITEEENEQNVRWAADRLGFILKSEWKLLPSGECDGFYIAVLEKRY